MIKLTLLYTLLLAVGLATVYSSSIRYHSTTVVVVQQLVGYWCTQYTPRVFKNILVALRYAYIIDARTFRTWSSSSRTGALASSSSFSSSDAVFDPSRLESFFLRLLCPSSAAEETRRGRTLPSAVRPSVSLDRQLFDQELDDASGIPSALALAETLLPPASKSGPRYQAGILFVALAPASFSSRPSRCRPSTISVWLGGHKAGLEVALFCLCRC